MKTVIVTGANGFIGRNLVRHLVSQNIKVYALVLPEEGQKIIQQENVKVIKGNLLEWESIQSDLPDEPDAFTHLAWVGVSPEYREDIDLQKKNIEISLNAVKLASSIRAKRFILPGSTSEYLNSGQLINGSTVPSPQNAYSAIKVSLRYICEVSCRELGLPYIYVVITGIYAADRNDNNVIYYAISELLQKKRPVFTKLEQLWDYVHIDDVVYALYLISVKGKAGAFYTIGHGDNWALANYIYKIRDIIDSRLPLGIGEIPYKNNKIPSSCVDLTAIHEDTGFEPQVSFDEGIKEVIQEIEKPLQV